MTPESAQQKQIRLEAGKKKISPYKCINTRRGKKRCNIV
jgi:hypothetical protein